MKWWKTCCYNFVIIVVVVAGITVPNFLQYCLCPTADAATIVVTSVTVTATVTTTGRGITTTFGGWMCHYVERDFAVRFVAYLLPGVNGRIELILQN